MNQELPFKKPRNIVTGQGNVSPNQPLARRHLANAFLKLCPNIDTETVSYMWVEPNGSNVNPRFVTLRPGLSVAVAKARVVRHWDTMEAERVGK